MAELIQIKCTNRRDCFISLPPKFSQIVRMNYSQGEVCSVVLVETHDLKLYFGWTGEQSESDLEINQQFATLNGIQDRSYVNVQIVKVNQINNISVKVRQDDYLIIEHKRAHFEQQFLNQIQVIYDGIKFPIHHAQSTVIMTYQGPPAQIAANAELEILIHETKQSQQTYYTVQIDHSIKSLNNILYANINGIRKVQYMSKFPHLYRNIQQYTKHIQKTREQKKASVKKEIFALLESRADVPDGIILIDAIQAKVLSIKQGQLLSITESIEYDPQTREYKRDQLLHSNIFITIYIIQGPNIRQELIHYLMFDLLEHYDQILLRSRFYNFKTTVFYLKIEQRIQNQIPHFIKSLIITCENKLDKNICEREAQLYFKYFDSNLFEEPITQKQLKELKYHKFKHLFKNTLPNLMFDMIFYNQLEQIRLMSKVQVVHKLNSGISQLKYHLLHYISLNIQNLNKAEGRIDIVKAFIKQIFRFANDAPILIKGTSTLNKHIDFQESQQILISLVLQKLLRKLIIAYPNTKVVVLSPRKDQFNEFLNDVLPVVEMTRPNRELRIRILQEFFPNEDVPVEQTENFSYAEFDSIRNRAIHTPINQSIEQLQIGSKNIQKTPTFAHVGGFKVQKQILLDTIQLPIKYEQLFKNIKLPKSVLLYGMPGCGKSYLAQALCNELKINTISVKGPELLDKYIGASEQKVRELFEQAQEMTPCIIFLDEFDSIVPTRTASNSGVTDRIVNQFLCYLDGVEEGMKGVYIIAATSRPDLIDPALLRPGRIDKHLLLEYPTRDDILEIIQMFKGPLKIEIDDLADRLLGLSQADVVAFFKETRIQLSDSVIQMKDLRDTSHRHVDFNFILNSSNIDKIMKNVRPSLSKSQIARYKEYYYEFVHGKQVSKNQKQMFQ